MISGLHHGINEILTLLGCYAASIRSHLPTFWENLSVTSSMVKQACLTMHDGTDRPSQNVIFV